MKTIAIWMLCLATFGAGAQTVYRCGSEYSQAPCPQAKAVAAADPRTDAQRAEAERVAADEKHLGARMERERLALLSAQKPTSAGSLSAAPPKPAEHSHAKKLKWAKAKKAKKSPARA